MTLLCIAWKNSLPPVVRHPTREQTKNSQNTRSTELKDPAKHIEVIERVTKSDVITPNEIHSPPMLEKKHVNPINLP